MQTLTLKVNQELDVTDLSCPLPLLKAKLILHSLNSGDELRILALKDQSRDLLRYGEQTEQLLKVDDLDENQVAYWLRKK
ncbi:MAG: sulfurtransferase TusA family protein [Pseudomonadota bacterium]